MRAIALIALFLVTQGAVAQEAEWNSYYGELKEYEFKYPDTWLSGAGDKQKAASMVLVFDKAGTTGVVILTMRCAFALGKDMSSKQSVVKKTAKKAKDDHFKMINEDGEMEFAGEKCKWMEYTATQKLDDGTVLKQTCREYLLHHRTKGALYADLFTIKLYTNTDSWAAQLPVFEKILASFKFVEPAK